MIKQKRNGVSIITHFVYFLLVFLFVIILMAETRVTLPEDFDFETYINGYEGSKLKTTLITTVIYLSIQVIPELQEAFILPNIVMHSL